MFRLPHSNRTYFQCEVTICKDRCPKVNCADVNEQLKLQAEGQLTTIEDEADPFEAAPDDSVTTSTSVFIAQPGSSASGKQNDLELDWQISRNFAKNACERTRKWF